MITPSLSLLFLLSPGAQGPQNHGWQGIVQTPERAPRAGQQPASPQSPEKSRPRRRSDFEAPMPRSRPGSSAKRSGPPAARPLVETRAPRERPGAALQRVFESLGHPEDLRRLGGVISRQRLQILDGQGGRLSDIKMLHWVDYRYPARDRIDFSAASFGKKVYGRDGATAFVERHGFVLPGRQRQAAEELQVWGTLMRAPWCFADRRSFTAPVAGAVTIDGQRRIRIRMQERPARVAAGKPAPKPDVWELICAEETHRPLQLHYLPGATGRRVIMRLSRYQELGGVSLPTRRVILGPDGRDLLIHDLQRQVARELFREDLFQPRR